MKKQLLTMALGLVTASFSQAQLLVTYKDSPTTIMSGQTHVENIATDDEFYVDFSIFNTSSESKEVIVTRQHLIVPNGWTDYLCWGHSTATGGGTCYGSNANATWSTPLAVSIAPSEHGNIKIYINPASTQSAPGHYRYYFGDGQNPRMDSVDVYVNSVASVKELKKEFTMTVSPNPASNNLLIKTNGGAARIKMIDVLGNVILNDTFNGSLNLNVSEFKNGVYFIIVEGEGIGTMNRKVVIRH